MERSVIIGQEIFIQKGFFLCEGVPLSLGFGTRYYPDTRVSFYFFSKNSPCSSRVSRYLFCFLCLFVCFVFCRAVYFVFFERSRRSHLRFLDSSQAPSFLRRATSLVFLGPSAATATMTTTTTTT